MNFRSQRMVAEVRALVPQVTKKIPGARYVLLHLNQRRKYLLFGASEWRGWCSCNHTFVSINKRDIEVEAKAHVANGECPIEREVQRLSSELPSRKQNSENLATIIPINLARKAI